MDALNFYLYLRNLGALEVLLIKVYMQISMQISPLMPLGFIKLQNTLILFWYADPFWLYNTGQLLIEGRDDYSEKRMEK